MKRGLVILAVVVAATALISFAVTRQFARKVSEPGDIHGMLTNTEYLTRKLDLDGDQQKAIAELHDNLAARLQECCRDHCAARVGLAAALCSDSEEEVDCEALIQKMSQAYAESEKITFEHIRKVQELLTPEQRRIFEGMLMDAVRCSCPACRIDAESE